MSCIDVSSGFCTHHLMDGRQVRLKFVTIEGEACLENSR